MFAKFFERKITCIYQDLYSSIGADDPGEVSDVLAQCSCLMLLGESQAQPLVSWTVAPHGLQNLPERGRRDRLGR